MELPPEMAGRALKDILGPRLASPLAGFALRQTLAVAADAPLETFIAAASAHPVFELNITKVGRAQ